ncbi:NmrA-like family-domain-containing protein [Aspergillus pseudoustus]|uniref:NmrA-like family-domain-containing protein n=1 Tax=Aspergillus pseudoustus TaxID=1810923 RepID=A0ABR4JCR0_9EURO
MAWIIRLAGISTDYADQVLHAAHRLDFYAKASALAARGIEIVSADLDDEERLARAFADADAFFAVTDFYEPFATGVGAEKVTQIEYTRGGNAARAAARTATLQVYFWSTLPAARELTRGEVSVPRFDAKGEIDAYIKQAESGFEYEDGVSPDGVLCVELWVSLFTPLHSKPAQQWILPLPVRASSYLLSLSSVDTIGIIVSGLLQNPYPKTASGPRGGRYVHVTTGKYQIQEYFSKWVEIAGKGKLQVLSVRSEQFEALHGMCGTELGLMVKFWEVAGAPRMWGAVGDGDVIVDSRDL